jgi:hypothetical protein
MRRSHDDFLLRSDSFASAASPAPFMRDSLDSHQAQPYQQYGRSYSQPPVQHQGLGQAAAATG